MFYNFNTEGIKLPAFAAVGQRANLPTGRNSSGLDTSFTNSSLTKSLGYAEKLQRVHLNLTYFNNANRRAAGTLQPLRGGRWVTANASGRRRFFSTDLVRQQELQCAARTSNIFEVGLRYQKTPLKVFSLGLGAGLSSDSPDFRATFGYQQSF